MELCTYEESSNSLRKRDVFVVFDHKEDVDTADLILEELQSRGILFCTPYDCPGMSMFSVFAHFAGITNKAVFILSPLAAQNEALKYGMTMILFKLPKENIVTLLVSDTHCPDELQLLQHTTVVRTNSDTWLEDVLKELTSTMPSYARVLTRGNVIDSLTFQGLCIQHMQSNILGILVMADKSCLQLDLKEYLIHQQKHREYNTAKVIEEFQNLNDINATVVLILKDGVQDELQSFKDDVAVLSSAVIDTSLKKARCDWSVACTVKGKYQKCEEKFLSGIYPAITYTLMNKFIKSLQEPIMHQYENIIDRIESFPAKWREDDFEAVNDMSAAGFFYPGFGEAGRCFYCACLLTNIRTQEMPLLKHAGRYPTCPYVRSNLTDDKIKQATEAFKDIGEKTKLAETFKKRYESVEARIKTFETYEKVNGKCDVDVLKLAEAGFYYIGLENLFQCFCCSVRIYGIPTDQSAWSVHAHLAPSCPFVLAEKGKCFINEQQTAKKQTLNSDFTVISFIRKTCDGTKRRQWPENMFRPW